MLNAYILQKLASKKQRQLHFHQELLKLLIALNNGYKRPSNYGKFVIKTVTAKETLSDHFLVKLEAGRKLVPCAQKLEERIKAAPSKRPLHLNSMAFICCQCRVNNHVLPSSIVQSCTE